jgi:hypothetical protein
LRAYSSQSSEPWTSFDVNLVYDRLAISYDDAGVCSSVRIQEIIVIVVRIRNIVIVIWNNNLMIVVSNVRLAELVEN